MGLSKHWATDKKKEAGIVISFGDNGFGENMLFNISRMNRTNKTYSKKHSKNWRFYLRNWDSGRVISRQTSCFRAQN